MEPLLKWAGGKRSIAKTLIDLFPRDWEKGRYFEPFFGGGAVFFLAQPKSGVIADVNERLTNFYRQVQTDPEAVIAHINDFGHRFNSATELAKVALYSELRTELNMLKPNSAIAAARLFAVNKLCFNGLYRENRRGEFNVPFGKKSQLSLVEPGSWSSHSALLRNAEVELASFDESTATSTAGDFVYFDPPYIPLTLTSNFTAYNSVGFGVREQIRLASNVARLTERGVHCMVSNSDTPLTRRIFKRFTFEEVQVQRAVGAQSESRGKVPELIIRNYAK